jgi:hypothetical protein
MAEVLRPAAAAQRDVVHPFVLREMRQDPTQLRRLHQGPSAGVNGTTGSHALVAGEVLKITVSAASPRHLGGICRDAV